MYCTFILCFVLSFSGRMPELHINGRFRNHDPSMEINAVGTSYVTSSSLMSTGRLQDSSTAISTTTDTMDSESSLCGIVSLIIYLSFALIIMIVIGIWLVRKKNR